MKVIRLFLLVVFCLGFVQMNAQFGIKDKLREEAAKKIEKGIQQGSEDKNASDADQTKEEVDQSASENQEEAGQDVKTATKSPSLQSYSKFDFIPGEKVIFYEDLSQSAIGDFPANWNTNASGEVVTTNLYPGKWFIMTGEGCVSLDEGIDLPDNYTIEYDVIANPKEEGNEFFEYGFYMYSANNPKDLGEGGAVPGLNGGIKMSFGSRCSYSAYDESGYTIDGMKEDIRMEAGKKYHLSFWVQKTRLRVYLDEVKVFDLPKVFKTGFKCNMMRFELWESAVPMITNFRIAAGLPDMRNKLMTDGKLVSYGIYFDVNKDEVKPQSYGTLKEIAAILNEVPDVKVKIFGHTDSDGDDSQNMDLSKRRAASVKAELVKSFGVKADQLQTDGLGETKPVAPNDTPVNKALNRRVEFIKL